MTDHVEFVETVEWDISADHLQHNYKWHIHYTGLWTATSPLSLKLHLVIFNLNINSIFDTDIVPKKKSVRTEFQFLKNLI